MPVSAVVISCRHERCSIVKQILGHMEKVEIYHILENGRLVAVLDTGSVEDEVSIVKEIIQTDGVMDVQLAYHNFEDLEDLQS